jgi:hypothetical protein
LVDFVIVAQKVQQPVESQHPKFDAQGVALLASLGPGYA